MQKVGLKTLKNRLSAYVRLAARGEIIQVTDRDRVVAEIGPPRSASGDVPDEVWEAEAVRQGWLVPAADRMSPLPARGRLAPFDELMRELQQDRDDR